MKQEKKALTLKTLTKSNVWGIQENDVFRMWEAAEKDADLPAPARPSLAVVPRAWGRVWVVESLQGQHVATLSSQSDRLDVRSIVNGVYVLRALNSKGVGHRLGMFTKK